MLTRNDVKVEQLVRGSDGADVGSIKTISDKMLGIILNGPTVNSINKGVFRGLVRELYAELQERERGDHTFNKWAADIHGNAVAHGWWEEERNLLEIVALCHSELSEAVEEYRAGRPLVYCHDCGVPLGEMAAADCTECLKRGVSKPEGVAVELVDCVIRILDYLGHVGVDVDAIMEEKYRYNLTRPYKHGKRC